MEPLGTGGASTSSLINREILIKLPTDYSIEPLESLILKAYINKNIK